MIQYASTKILNGCVISFQVDLGTFQLFPGDAMVKFSHRCSHAVEATSSTDKEGIQVGQAGRDMSNRGKMRSWPNGFG